MDPWSKGDYSRHIREESMAMDGLPEGVPPSGRVPGQLLQAAPILKRRRRYRGEFVRKRSILGVSTPRGKYRRRGASRGPTRQSGGSLARLRVGPRHLPSWRPAGGARPGPGWGPRPLPPGCLVVAPLPSLDDSESLCCADFFYIFPEFLEHF